MTVCEIAPEVAVIVTWDTAGAGEGVCVAAGIADDELLQPASAPRETMQITERSAPRNKAVRRRTPAKPSNPSGINPAKMNRSEVRSAI